MIIGLAEESELRGGREGGRIKLSILGSGHVRRWREVENNAAASWKLCSKTSNKTDRHGEARNSSCASLAGILQT